MMNQESPVREFKSFISKNNITITILNDESIISGGVLKDRKIIVSDIWQQSIFSKTVRICAKDVYLQHITFDFKDISTYYWC